MHETTHATPPSGRDLVVGAFLLTIFCVDWAKTTVKTESSGGPPTLRVRAATLDGLSRFAQLSRTYEPFVEGVAIGAVITTSTFGTPPWLTVTEVLSSVGVEAVARRTEQIEAERRKAHDELQRWRTNRATEVSMNAAAGLFLLFLGLALVGPPNHRKRGPWWLRLLFWSPRGPPRG